MKIFILFFLCFVSHLAAIALPFNWNSLSISSSPPGRRDAAMVYDPSGQMILSGGKNEKGVLNDTWAYDSQKKEWEELSPRTPAPKLTGASMAYDPSSGLAILFGGLTGTRYSSDVWAWGLDTKRNPPQYTWTQVIPSSSDDSPLARAYAAMEYNPCTGELILFGGYNGARALNDTWALKFNQGSYTWRKLSFSNSNHPPARIYASMAFYPKGKMILFGGFDLNQYFDDTWTLDSYLDNNGNPHYTWNPLSFVDSPPRRAAARMAFNPAKGEMTLFGGTYKTINGQFVYLNDTWALSLNDVDSYAWSLLSPPNGTSSPSPRAYTSMNFDTSGQMILFGGQGEDSRVFLSDTWSFAPPPNLAFVLEKLELNASDPRPKARIDASMAFDPCSGQIVLFGGFSDNGVLGDTWVFNLTTKIWKKLNPTGRQPSNRFGAPMAFNPCNGLLFMFGGQLYGNFYNDTWILNLKTETWEELFPSNRPSHRGSSAMVFDPSNGLMVLFGGSFIQKNSIIFMNDTWTFNTSANTWTELSVSDRPPPQSRAPMTFDPCIGKVVLYNNSTPYPGLRETWTLNTSLNQWTKLQPTEFMPASGFQVDGPMVFNPCTGQDILYRRGNLVPPYYSGLWKLSDALANAWKHLDFLLPEFYLDALMDFDSSNGEMVIYMSNGIDLSEVWTLSTGLASDLEAVESPLPPVHLKGFQQANKFATQTDYVNVLTWDPPSGGSSIVKYRIYRISQDQLLNKLIGEVSSEATLRFKDHNRTKGKTYTYSIVSEDELGAISAPTIVKIKGKVLS